MTRPFRDPVIYPGVPIEPAVGRWCRLRYREHVCAIGGEVMKPRTIARFRDGSWECRDHVHAERTEAVA